MEGVGWMDVGRNVLSVRVGRVGQWQCLVRGRAVVGVGGFAARNTKAESRSSYPVFMGASLAAREP